MIPQAPPAIVERRLVLRAEQLLCEEAVADPKTLIDEAEISGDPASGKGGAPKSAFFPGWESPWRYPIHVTLDLGAEIDVTRLFFYIEGGGGSLGISTGTPFDWNNRDKSTARRLQIVEGSFDRCPNPLSSIDPFSDRWRFQRSLSMGSPALLRYDRAEGSLQ